MRELTCHDDDPLESNYTKQCINNVRQTFARRLLFNRNASLIVKMTLKIANYSADNALHREQNCVESVQLGRHSADSQNWPFSRQKFRIILKTNYLQQVYQTALGNLILSTCQMQVF